MQGLIPAVYVVALFTFHYGSILIEYPFTLSDVLNNLHSTMVLF